jgi:DNA-binding MarR family transcriptional regulator
MTDNPVHYLAAIQRQHQMNVTRALRPVGVTAPMWRVLALLTDAGDCTISQMADMTALDRTALGRLLETMEGLGLVQRNERSPEDRRSTIVAVTAKGEEAFQAALPIIKKLNARLREGVSDDEFAVLMNVLRRMKANALVGG